MRVRDAKGKRRAGRGVCFCHAVSGTAGAAGEKAGVPFRAGGPSGRGGGSGAVNGVLAAPAAF